MNASSEVGVDERYGVVADAFAANFRDPGEDAAAVSVFVDGRKVVDLVGGRDRTADRAMPQDGLMMVASASKGITAAVLAQLVGRGDVDPEAPVTTYWPEFAAAGKEDVTVGMVASHTAGLPYPPLRSGLTGLDLHRGSRVTELLAGMAPLWNPGEAMAYHPVSYGTLLDEIVHRATGADISTHLQTSIAVPLGLNMWIGVPQEELARVVRDRWERVPTAPHDAPSPTPGSYADLRRQFLDEDMPMDLDLSDERDFIAHYTARRPAVGVVTDARSLATMYAALIGEVDGVRLIDDATLDVVTRPRTDGIPALVESGTTGPDIRFGLGFQLASPSMPGLGSSSFGHTGAGGRLGIADPERGVAVGYICSRMRPIGPHGDPRWARILDAVRATTGGR
ncbi:serine hydrolase domain-containing protein [Microbacterium saperdae]